MKLLLFLLFFIVLSVANAAEEEKVVVGNPGSRNNLQVNQFYVISQPRPQYNSQTIIETPENRETFSTENNTLLIDADKEFSDDRF